MMAAILFCGVAAMFTSCTNEDNPVKPVDNLSEKIIGKWMVADIDGQAVPTNKKSVYTIVSTTEAYMSVSIAPRQDEKAVWNDQEELDVALSGNKMTLTMQSDEHTTIVEEFAFITINDAEFTANHKITVTMDGNVMLSNEGFIRFIKLTADYSEEVLGLWECTGLTGIETYNDANARLEFLADGTYRYYRKDDGGQWQAITTREFQDYFVDGTLLATRWMNQGEAELHEWWEIESLSGNEMVWTALRENEDGFTAQQKMTWKKIDLNVSEKIIGKWIIADKDGQPMPTDQKNVFDFVSATKVYMSASLNAHPEVGTPWQDLVEGDVAISDNKVIATFHDNEHTTAVHEFTMTAINGIEFTANHKVTVTVNGNVMLTDEDIIRLVKVNVDYRQAILGTWEGHCTSEGSVFDDGQEHRWQYNADGTYVYYVKDGDNWVPYATTTLCEYFVDGNLLCTRWIDLGQENREWWEITINGDKMNWTALRQNTDGTTFTATFEMTKAN